MNKNINNVVELTEKELACVCGGSPIPLSTPGEIRRAIKAMEDNGQPPKVILEWLKRYMPAN